MKNWSKGLSICEKVARFAPLCRGPRFAGPEILLCLYEASSPVCGGSIGPRDIYEKQELLLCVAGRASYENWPKSN